MHFSVRLRRGEQGVLSLQEGMGQKVCARRQQKILSTDAFPTISEEWNGSITALGCLACLPNGWNCLFGVEQGSGHKGKNSENMFFAKRTIDYHSAKTICFRKTFPPNEIFPQKSGFVSLSPLLSCNFMSRSL